MSSFQFFSPASGWTEDVYRAAQGMAWDTTSCDTPREDDEREDHAGLIRVTFDIPEDSYGAAILAIVKEMHLIGKGNADSRMSFARFMAAIVLLILNLVSQMLILWFISKHVVRPAVRDVQLLYRDFHKNVYDEDGFFSGGALA